MLRAARPDEAAAAQDVVDRAFARYVPRIGRRPRVMGQDLAPRVSAGEVLVFEQDGAIAGVLVLVEEHDHMYVDVVAVAPGWQGRGLGRVLLEEAEARARAARLGEVRLYTNAAMTENLAMYPHLGFREVARCSEEGFHRVFFVKALGRHGA